MAYVREDALLEAIDEFFATRIFGPERIACFRTQHQDLAAELQTDDGVDRRRLESEVEQRIERQLTAIERGVDPTVVGERIRELKEEHKRVEAALAETEPDLRQDGVALTFEQACEVLDDLPDLREALANADPKVRRAVYEAFRLSVEIDRNAGQIRMKTLVSSAFRNVRDLEGLTGLVAESLNHKDLLARGGPSVAHRGIAGARSVSRGDRRLVDKIAV